nr:esterase/lipase [Rhizobium sp. P007]
MYRKKLMAFCLFMSSGSAFAGHIQDATFHSAALNAPLPVNIYRPEGPPPENGWPVLYLLHGHDGDQNSWRDLGNIEKTLDTLIEAGAIRPLVVVMPGVKNSWYVDSAAVGGPGDYETALTGDLRH